MHKVLVAMYDETIEEDESQQVRGWLREELPDLQVSFADDLDEALAAPPPDIVITNSHRWLPELVRERAGIEWIHLLSAGADSLLRMDLPFERLRVSTSSGVHTATISEYVLAGALYHTKAFGRFATQQRERRWERPSLGELEGSTMAILGLGAIGKGIAVRAKAFGMRVIGTKRTPEPVEFVDDVYDTDLLHDVLSQGDVIAVTVPLTPATHHLLGPAEFAVMRVNAILVNVARGRVIDEIAMIAALRQGRPRAAVLDVFEQEPLPPGSPLWDMENVLITPHVAGTTPVYMRKAVEVFAQNYRSWHERGVLTTAVDAEAGY